MMLSFFDSGLRWCAAGGLLALCACGESSDATPGKFNAKATNMYVTVSSDDQVVVIDDTSHEIVHRYAVGGGPAIILHTPRFEKLYTANWASDSISSIDIEADRVVNIATDGRPYVIAMDQAGRYVYAGLDTSQIVVIDTQTDTVIRTIPTTELPASLIVSPDGTTLYVAYLNLLTLGLGAGFLEALSAETGEVVKAPIPVGRAPAWITISPNGKQVFTLNFLSDDVSVVDTDSFAVTATVHTGAGTQGIIGNVTPDNSRLYVTNHGTSDMVGIDTKTSEVVQTIDLDGRPVGVNFSPDGKRVYTTDFGPQSANEPLMIEYLLTGNFNPTGDGQVRVFDVQSGDQVGSTISVGPGPTSVVVGSK